MARFTLEVECLKCDSCKTYDAKTRQELDDKLAQEGWSIKKKGKLKTYICMKHKFGKKNIKLLALKMSNIIRRKLKRMEKLKAKDLWDVVPQIMNLNEYKKRDLRKIYKCMAILQHHDIHHPKLMHDITLELSLRSKTDKEKEKVKSARKQMTEKWTPRALQVLEEIKKSKETILPMIKDFAKEIYDEDYLKISLVDCEKMVVKLLKEIGEERKKEKKEKKDA
jgi:hypothetical protein